MCLKFFVFFIAELQSKCQLYWKRIAGLEADKYDCELALKIRAYEVLTNKQKNQSKQAKSAAIFFVFLFIIFFYNNDTKKQQSFERWRR